jgi:hypothetical protein
MRERRGVAFDDEVEIERLATHQQVAHSAAYQVHSRHVAEAPQQRLRGRQRADSPEQLGRIGDVHGRIFSRYGVRALCR